VAGGSVRNYVQRRDWLLQGFNITGAANDDFLGRGKDMKWYSNDDTTHQLIDNDKGLNGATLGIFPQLRNYLAGFINPPTLQAEGEMSSVIATEPRTSVEQSTLLDLDTLAQQLNRELIRRADSLGVMPGDFAADTREHISQDPSDIMPSFNGLRNSIAADEADKPARIKRMASNNLTDSSDAVDSLFNATSPWTGDFARDSDALGKHPAKRRVHWLAEY
jgi:hypothetical protein